MTATQNGKLQVSAIKNGTVIDHIQAGMALKILGILGVEKHDKTVTIGMYLKSKTSQKKDIIKLTDWEITPEKANRIAIFSPDTTVNIIENYEVVKKHKIDLPETITGLIVCPNPKCITNNESMETKFKTITQTGSVKFQCHYCEKKIEQDEIKAYNI